MIRNCTTILLFCLVLAVAQPAFAQGPPEPLTKEALESVLNASLKKMEANLTKDIANLRGTVLSLQLDIANVKTQQVEMKAQLDAQRLLIDKLMDERKFVANSSPATDKTVEEIRVRLSAIENAIARMNEKPVGTMHYYSGPATDKTAEEIRNRLSAIENAIARLPLEKPASTTHYYNGPGITSSARMNLVNVFSEKIAFKVNGIVHIVPPQSTKPLDNIPVGTTTYDVYSMRHGLLDVGSVTLLAGETYTLTVIPKR